MPNWSELSTGCKGGDRQQISIFLAQVAGNGYLHRATRDRYEN